LFRTTVSYDCFVSMYEDAIDPSPRSIDPSRRTKYSARSLKCTTSVPTVYVIGPCGDVDAIDAYGVYVDFSVIRRV